MSAANTHDEPPVAPLGVQMNSKRLHKRASTDLYIETGLFMDHASYR